MQFNYLGESVPSLLDRARALRVPVTLRAPLLGLVTAILIVTAWWALEGHAYARALREYDHAQARLFAVRALLRTAKIERKGVDHLVLLDQQLRAVRSSGSVIGARVVRIANRIPDRVWLTSFAPVPGGFDISGRAVGMVRLSETIAALGVGAYASTSLVRATRLERAGGQPLIAFELHIDE